MCKHAYWTNYCTKSKYFVHFQRHFIHTHFGTFLLKKLIFQHKSKKLIKNTFSINTKHNVYIYIYTLIYNNKYIMNRTFFLQGAKALEDFAESVRNESNTALPKDGTVAEGTSNVLVFLEQLAEYADTAGAVLRRNTDIDQTVSSTKNAEKGHRMVLGVYVSKCVCLCGPSHHLFSIT